MNKHKISQFLSERGISVERQYWILVCFGIVGAGLLSLILLITLKSEPLVVPQKTRTPIIDGQLITPQTGRFDIVASGRVQAVERVRLQALITGDVISVSEKLKSGAYFSKGDVLLTINPLSFDARVNELIAQRQSAEADLQLAQTQLARTRQLVSAKAAATEELDQRDAAVKAAKARMLQIDASLVSARLNVARSQIRAPFDGRVVSESVSVGDVLAPGNAFAEIYSTESFEVPVALPVSDAVLLDNLFSQDATQQSLPARIEAEFAGMRFQWPARVDRVEAGLDPSTRTIDVVLRVDDPLQPGQPIGNQAAVVPPLLPNMFVSAALQTAEQARFVKLDRDTVRADGTIWLVPLNGSEEGEVQALPSRLLSAQNGLAFVEIPDLPVLPSFALGSDIGSVIPGNRVRIRDSAKLLGQNSIGLGDQQSLPVEHQNSPQVLETEALESAAISDVDSDIREEDVTDLSVQSAPDGAEL